MLIAEWLCRIQYLTGNYLCRKLELTNLLPLCHIFISFKNLAFKCTLYAENCAMIVVSVPRANLFTSVFRRFSDKCLETEFMPIENKHGKGGVYEI